MKLELPYISGIWVKDSHFFRQTLYIVQKTVRFYPQLYFEAGFSPAKTLNDNYYEDIFMNCTRFTISTIGLKHEFTKSPVFFDAGLH